MKSTSAGTFFTMPSLKRNLRILATIAALSLLSLAAGCRGFFVNPTLTAMTVAPTSASIIQGGTQQINATGNYNDGSTKDLTGSATWTTSASAVATVSKGGLVTAASSISNPPGTAIITATSGTITASSTITVNTGPLTAIAISTTTPNPAAGQTVVFTALGTYSGSAQQQDITNLVTWSSSNTAVIATISSGSGAVLSTATSGATTSVTASLNGINSNALTITVQ
jgi:Bacterial Ig-like domain (group 2)